MSEDVGGSVGGGLRQECGLSRTLGDRDRLKNQMASRALQPVEKSLIFILKRLELADQTLSDLAKDRESFGLAWLMVQLCMRNNEKENVPVEPPRRVDLSGSIGLSAKKLFFFLDFLPYSVEEIKLDSVAVKGDALPLFLRYLERANRGVRESEDFTRLSRFLRYFGGFSRFWREQGTTESRGREGFRLKSFIFAENSLGPEEAVKVFPLLLPSLEKLCLKGNHLGTEGFEALAKCMLSGSTSSLRVLDLENTRLNRSLEIFCRGLQKGLGLHTLNLSENGLSDVQLGVVASVLRRGRLADLETLGLRGDFPLGGRAPSGLPMLGEVLCGGAVPRLKNVNLIGRGDSRGWHAWEVKVFLNFLSFEKCKGLEDVQLHVQSAREEDLRALASGKFPAIRTLCLNLNPSKLIEFLQGLGTESSFDALDLTLSITAWAAETEDMERLTLLGDVILRGGLDSLRKIRVEGVALPNNGVFAEGKTALFGALGVRELCRFSELILQEVNLHNEELILFAEAVRVGNLPMLRVLDLQMNRGVGREGVEALMDAVVESERGLPSLEKLNLTGTNGGGGAGSLGRALLSGMLGGLSVIILQSCGLTDEGLRGLAEAVREGGLVGVSYLDMGLNYLGGTACGEFLHAIAQSKGGLPILKELRLS